MARQLIAGRKKQKGKYEQADTIGASLKRKREAKNKTIAELAHQLNIPANQLLALEEGNLEAFPSQLVVLSALRQYAKALKLDGDALALSLLESWSVQDSEEYLEKSGRQTSTSVKEPPNSLVASKSTIEIPIVGNTTKVLSQKRSRSHVVRPKKAPTAPLALRIMFWVVVLLVIAGFVGLYLEHTHPQWFTAVTHPTVAPTIPGTSSNNPISSSKPTGNSLIQLSSSSSQANYKVPATSYSIKVSAGQTCWVEITVPNTQNPDLFSGELQQGQSETFNSQTRNTVIIGASNCSLKVFSGSKVFGVLTPSTTPFTYVLTNS